MTDWKVQIDQITAKKLSDVQTDLYSCTTYAEANEVLSKADQDRVGTIREQFTKPDDRDFQTELNNYIETTVANFMAAGRQGWLDKA
jgi:ectoine hydroxylase-related dioxygenase (phytanoyl-CoA dioxygenase family)